MNASLDRRDVEILFSIAEQRSASAETIHEATDIPKSTVHYRIQGLKEKGVITDELLALDREKVGLDITVISEVWAEFDENYHEEVGRQLSDVEGVDQVYFTMGDTDFVVISRLFSRDMVERLITDYEAIEAVERTSSKFAITPIKEHLDVTALQNYDRETLFETQEIDADESE